MSANTPAGQAPIAASPPRSEPRAGEAIQLADRLNELFHGHRLSPAQRRIARHLVSCGYDAVFLNSIDIAKAVQVSQPSVTRFAFALGFDGFPELREEIRKYARASSAVAMTPRHHNLIQALIASDAQNMTALAESLADPTRLQRVAAGLVSSRPLPILGLRVSAPLADYLGRFAAKFLPDVRVLTNAGTTLTDEISRSAEVGGTWMLAVGLPRYPRELRDAMRWARACGLKVALITDSAIGPLAEHADEILTAPVNSDFAFDSHAAPSALSAALLHTMLDSLPEADQASLEAFEQRAEAQDTFLEQ